MVLQSTPAKILLALFGIVFTLLLIDFLLFQWENTTYLIQGLLTSFTINLPLSWALVIIVIGLIFFITSIHFYRRRHFKNNLRHELNEAERITLLELAQKLDETPAKIEVELNRMASSRVKKLPGLLIISQGKHVYLGQKLINRIINSYNDDIPRGDIANEYKISRIELDKAIDYLINSGIVEEREEKTTRKVRPSYRRGSK